MLHGLKNIGSIEEVETKGYKHRKELYSGVCKNQPISWSVSDNNVVWDIKIHTSRASIYPQLEKTWNDINVSISITGWAENSILYAR